MNQRRVGVILGYVYLLLRNGSSFIMTPLMIDTWGKSQYGIFQLGMTIAAYFTLMDLGVQNSIVKFVSQYRAENDKQKESLFVGTVISFYFLASIVIILLSLLVGNNLHKFFDQSLTVSEIGDITKIFFVLMIGAIFNLFFNVFAGVSTAYEKFSVIRYRDIGKTVIRFFAILLMLRMQMNPFYIIVADTIINVLFNLTLVWVVWFDIRVRPSLKGASFSYFKSILNYSFFVYLNVIAIQFFWMVDNIILGVMTSAAIVGVYSLGTLVSSYFQSFSSIITNVLMPGVVKLVTKGSSSEVLLNEAVRIGRIKLVFFVWLSICFIFFGKKFILLWAGTDFEPAYYVATIIIVPQIVAYTHDVLANVMWAKEKHKFFSLFMMIVSLLNILLTVFLVNYIGFLGAAYGSAFAFIVGFILFASIYYHKVIEIDMRLFYFRLFKGIFPAALITSTVAFFISYLNEISWPILFLQGALLSVFYGVIFWLVGINTYEKALFRSLVLKKN